MGPWWGGLVRLSRPEGMEKRQIVVDFLYIDVAGGRGVDYMNMGICNVCGLYWTGFHPHAPEDSQWVSQ
jgi:hypothetical protein